VAAALGSATTVMCVAAVYVGTGALIMSTTDDIPQWYMALLFLIYFKVLFRYDKCTVSYVECKARGVNKCDGYIYSFLDSFNRLREDTVVFVAFTGYVALLAYAYFVVLGKSMRM
jgi:hypothetical protein